MEPLPAAILREVYDAFSEGPRPRTIDACPCCVDAERICTLLSTPLRQITPQQLGGYASSVFLTVGSEADFLYFLPRILAVLSTEEGWWPAPEVVGKAMANIPWPGYTEGQRGALTNYFGAVFDTLLNTENPDGWEIDSWLCCTSHILPRWEDILERLLATPKALTALYEWHSEALQKQRLGNGFWDNSPGRNAFLEWMLSERTKSMLMAEWGF